MRRLYVLAVVLALAPTIAATAPVSAEAAVQQPPSLVQCPTPADAVPSASLPVAVARYSIDSVAPAPVIARDSASATAVPVGEANMIETVITERVAPAVHRQRSRSGKSGADLNYDVAVRRLRNASHLRR